MDLPGLWEGVGLALNVVTLAYLAKADGHLRALREVAGRLLFDPPS